MPYKLSVDLPAVNAGYDYAVLTGKSNTFSYSDGRRISDEAIGVKLTVALQGARFAPLTIRYSHDPLPKVNDEDIEAACVSNNLCSNPGLCCQPLFKQQRRHRYDRYRPDRPDRYP